MKIGIVGYQGSGKSTLFQWLTDETPDPSLSHATQSAMAAVPEPRVASLCEIYQPKKVTLASIEVVDTPGLSRGHEGNAARLAQIREAGCLVIVVGAYVGHDAAADLKVFEEDLLLADLDIVANRIERLRDQIRRPRPNRDEMEAELEALLPLHDTLENGQPLRDLELSELQKKAIRSFQLFTEKPRLAVINVADDQDPTAAAGKVPGEISAFGVSLQLEIELAGMDEEERRAFCEEMQVAPVDRDSLIRQMMDVSGQFLFFTAGDKEVRTWMLPCGATAVDAADGIHTDLARGFIRAETMHCDDLLRLGSEREVKAQSLMRQEPRDYVVKEGDILLIRHN